MTRDRDAILARDGYRCVWCMRALATDVHEIVPRSRHSTRAHDTVTFVEANMVSLCRACHMRVGQRRWFRAAIQDIMAVRYGYRYQEVDDEGYSLR